jgi:hypothetical protein
MKATLVEIDYRNEIPKRLCGKDGRGIVAVEAIKNLVAADYYIAVCCHDFAIYLMQGRWNARADMTCNLFRTEWPDDIKSLASKFGRADNIRRSLMEVELA